MLVSIDKNINLEYFLPTLIKQNIKNIKMLRFVIIAAVVNVFLPVNDALSLNMTKNLKVVVSSNNYPESGLEILREQYVLPLFAI